MSELGWRRRAAHWLITLTRRFAAAFFLLILAIVYVAPHVTKVTTSNAAVIGSGFAVLTAVVFHLVDLTIQVESIQKKLDAKSPGGRLFTLNEAIEDLFQTLDRRAGSRPAKISIFALHMENMSKWLPKAVRASKSRSIELSIFLVTPRLEELGRLVPYEVEKACRNMGGDLEKRKQEFERLSKDLRENQGRKLTIEIKHYPSVPHAFGLSVREPIQLSYIQFCRHFDVPDVEYLHRVDQATATAAETDLGDAFTGMFDHLWKTIEKRAWQFPLPKSQIVAAIQEPAATRESSGLPEVPGLES